MVRPWMTVILLSAAVAAGCGSANASKRLGGGTTPTMASSTAASAAPASITVPASTTSTTPPTTSTTICPLSLTPGTPRTVPVDEVCSATGAPHFSSPDAAMDYLATAWNSDNVQEIDYVT